MLVGTTAGGSTGARRDRRACLRGLAARLRLRRARAPRRAAGVFGRVTAAIAPLTGEDRGCGDIVTGSPGSEASAAVAPPVRAGSGRPPPASDPEPPNCRATARAGPSPAIPARRRCAESDPGKRALQRLGRDAARVEQPEADQHRAHQPERQRAHGPAGHRLAFREPVTEGADGKPDEDDDKDDAEQVDGVSKQRHQQRQARDQARGSRANGERPHLIEPAEGRSRTNLAGRPYLVETPLLAGRIPDLGAQ